jgi:molybdate transport system substrate-binding protein
MTLWCAARRLGLAAALGAAWMGTAGGARAGEVTAAVAANFRLPLRSIAARFEERSGHTVTLSSGSTGALSAQIENGAPFDVFFAADDERPALLEKAGLGVAGTRFAYAQGVLVLWSAQPGVVDDQGRVLVDGQFKRLALANPKIAPYGAAALQTLSMLGLWEATEGKRVIGENLGPTYQFIASGNADLGFVALSQLRADPQSAGGSQWIVPEQLYNPIRQEAILLRHGKNNPAAVALLAYVRTPRVRALLRDLGYDLP